MSGDAKVIIYRTIIRLVATYASETWVLSKESRKVASGVGEKGSEKDIWPTLCENGQWRIRKKEELHQMYNEEDIVTFIKKGHHRWRDCLKGSPTMVDPVELAGEEDLACAGWTISRMTSPQLVIGVGE